ALQSVDVADVDRTPVAEESDEDRKANRGLGRGNGQDEEHEHLSGGVAQLSRERDKVDVDREQHQFDAHQQHDHVLAVEEDARKADAEKRGAERQIMAERETRYDIGHGLVSSTGATGGVGRSAAIFTIRSRSPGRTRVCAAGSWCLAPTRRRSVSMTAAITAMVRITAATSNGRRKSVNSARASQVVLGTSVLAAAIAMLSANGETLRARMPIRTSISTSITTATSRPTGR